MIKFLAQNLIDQSYPIILDTIYFHISSIKVRVQIHFNDLVCMACIDRITPSICELGHCQYKQLNHLAIVGHHGFFSI